MKRLIACLAPLAVLLLVGPARADDNPGDRRGPRDGEMREKMLERFDKDDDGQLSRDERQEMRKAREDRTGERAKNGDRPPRGRRAEGDRPGRRGGPPEDMDRGLRRSGPPEDMDRGPRRGGPPEDMDRGPRRSGPPEDMDRGPRRGGPPEDMDRGPRRGGPPKDMDRGPRRGGQAGPPDPEVIFERMDRNGDGQLSKAEFMELARRMRARMGGDPAAGRPQGPPPRAAADDDRQGPPRGEFRRGRDRGEGLGHPRPERDDE